MNRIPPPIHAVPVAVASEHRASTLCPCRPVVEYRDLATTAIIYVHRDPERPPERRP